MDETAETARDLYRQGRGRADETKSMAEECLEDARTAMREQAAGFEQTIRHNVEVRPLMTVAVALGVGWVIGRMMHS
jgi:ElaB/YqjD/DUF883 family membrane-anchored ribosome-binding protein